MTSTVDSDSSVVVVGGGWAGIAAAVELTHGGIPVTLIESARQLGGRARCVRFGSARVDNGQHIMIGAYRNLLALLPIIGIEEQQVLLRSPLSLEMLDTNGSNFRLDTPNLPAPLHLLAGLLKAHGLNTRERLAALRFGRYLASANIEREEDISVQALLVSQKQPAGLIQKLWEPICIAALNTPIQIASARVFIHVLQQTFHEQRDASDLLLPRQDLGSLLPEPALDYIERKGGKVLLNRRVTQLQIEQNTITGLHIGDDLLPVHQLVLAVSPVHCRRLLGSHPAFADITAKLKQMQHQPITTVYLHYPESVALPRNMIGMLKGTSQWIFDRGINGQKGYIAVVISATGEHMTLDNDSLTQRITTELASLFPHWPAPLESLVIREKRATFSCHVGVESLRPETGTRVSGVYLAGDFTATGLPGTLEGAVASGRQSARQVLMALSSADSVAS